MSHFHGPLMPLMAPLRYVHAFHAEPPSQTSGQAQAQSLRHGLLQGFGRKRLDGQPRSRPKDGIEMIKSIRNGVQSWEILGSKKGKLILSWLVCILVR